MFLHAHIWPRSIAGMTLLWCLCSRPGISQERSDTDTLPRQVVSPGTRSVSILLLDLCHASIQSKNSTTGIFPTYLHLLKPPIQLRLSFPFHGLVHHLAVFRHQALSLWDGSWPPFAAEIRLELWKVTEATRLPCHTLLFVNCGYIMLHLQCSYKTQGHSVDTWRVRAVGNQAWPCHFLLNVMLSSNL